MRVGILGATGAVGLEVIEALTGHRNFSVSGLYASERSAGRPYRDASRLKLPPHFPEEIADRLVLGIDGFRPEDSDVVFSALPSEEAKRLEPEIARYLPVVSTTSAFRYEDAVPVLITAVNPGHAELLRTQRIQRGWKGFIAPEPNCTTVGLAMSLKPLYDALGIRRVIMTSYQAVSGAGYDALDRWGEQRTSLDLPKPFENPFETSEAIFEGNVIGYIKDEEEKVGKETLKTLGRYQGGRITPADFPISSFCVRVPTYRGHMEAVFVEPSKSCSADDVKSIYEEFNGRCRELYGDLPSSPEETIVLLDREPQPRLDVGINGGMSAVIGRIEVSNGLIKYLVLSDNLGIGAARGSVHVMEYLLREGYIG